MALPLVVAAVGAALRSLAVLGPAVVDGLAAPRGPAAVGDAAALGPASSGGLLDVDPGVTIIVR